MYLHMTDAYRPGQLGGLGGIDWDKVKDAAAKIGRGVLSAAKERAARELVASVSNTEQYREIERQVAAERAQEVGGQLGAAIKPLVPWVLLLGGVYVAAKVIR